MKTRSKYVIIGISIATFAIVLAVSYTSMPSDKLNDSEGSVPQILQDKDLQNLTLAKSLQMPYDEFAQLLVETTNDKIIEKRIDDEKMNVFTTEKENLSIKKGESLSYLRLIDYSLYGKNNAIPKENASEFVDKFMEKMGYVQDGSEWVQKVDFGDRVEIVIQQRKDGWIIQNQIMRFNFRDDFTSFEVDRWYTDLDSAKIKYSQDDAKKIAYDYIQEESKTNTEMQECGFKPSFAEYAQMEIIYDRMAYVVSGGGCSVEAWEGHYPWIQVMVDAVDGSVIGWRYGPLE